MKTIVRLLKLAAPFKWWMLLVALLGFLTVGSSIGLLMTSAYLISKAALHPSISELQVGIVGVRFFGISRGAFRYLERLAAHNTTFKILTEIRVRFYQAMEPLAPARLLQYKSSDLVNRIINDIQTLEHFFIRVLSPPLVAVAVSFLMWWLVGLFHSAFSFILFFFHLLAAVVVPLLGYLYSKGIGTKIICQRTEMYSLILDYVQGGSTLILFGQDDLQREKIDRAGRRMENLQQKMTRVSAMSEALVGLLMNGAVLAMLVFAIPLVNNSILDGVFLAVISLGIMASFEALLPLPGAMQFMEKNIRAAENLFHLMDSELPFMEGLQAPKAVLSTDIEIMDLTFAYEEQTVLQDINIKLPAGQKIAIVGPSGSGKSTLIQLLLRFWDYQSGSICLGGRELNEYDSEFIRTQFALVAQNTYLFNTTILENLKLASTDATLGEIQKATAKAQIRQDILSFENQYETEVGERGMCLSSGQVQRLAIARALLKDAPIILLDEATANLDITTEQAVLDTILQVSYGKTLVHITHRLKRLDAFDMIYVLQQGRIVQSGTHNQLMQTDGLYRKMYKLQNDILSLT